MSKYEASLTKLQGPDDARPTAAHDVKDEDRVGRIKYKVCLYWRRDLPRPCRNGKTWLGSRASSRALPLLAMAGFGRHQESIRGDYLEECRLASAADEDVIEPTSGVKGFAFNQGKDVQRDAFLEYSARYEFLRI
ncbi:uncharacterized protein B0I36DRAFT_363674 [Microdochium trichocladiopsis]|uniref:Uncharacterized protein n=1 Tax=Microdochium trichocladiopsis TaxID=1682393 RepID=A0A9P8Y4V6_9PEZI|nr:uncharacterized protein B0I36DRAFT_363674 [Microdochium trichocladiopsis]KAH7029085.1 hypothetical protein B0I36DRAFT_363674 [Microdochium trichocladiopsis]